MPSNLGFDYLIVYNADLEKWFEKYGLKPFWGTCSGCEKKLYVDQPYVAHKKRGLIAVPCSCGSRNTPFSYMDIGYDEINLNYLAMGTTTGVANSQVSKGSQRKVPRKLRLVHSSC